MGKLIKHREAMAYLESIPDPIVRALISQTYGNTFLLNPYCLEGDFDLLFFFRTLETLLCHREQLARALLGEATEHSWVGE